MGPRRWERLVEVEERLRAELPGTTLSHTDLRADNLMIGRDPWRGDRVWFVDWAHAQNAASWLDAGTLLADVVASRADIGDGGPVDVVATAREHPAMSAADAGQLWRLVLGLAGALHGLARQPSPSGLPTLRRWQGVTADTLLAWCIRQDITRPG